MKKTLIVVLSYNRANQMLERHWPYLRLSGADILGVGREDSECRFPSAGLVATTKIGKDSYVNGANLPSLMLGALEFCLKHDTLRYYSDFFLIEPDAICTRRLPEHTGGLITTLAGGSSTGFLGKQFFHTPWWFDGQTALAACMFGRRMIRDGHIEQGFPDRFLGLLAQWSRIPWRNGPFFSVNRIDRPEYVNAARKAIEAGAVYVHGIKTEPELIEVTEGLVSL